ncbi:MAG TPA: hypothetical protein VMM83_08660 [Longimicrobiales bacterium]|nr:hypothetical protein [Longimicrobiales bacterium]
MATRERRMTAGEARDPGDAPARRFSDETGVVWTAELRRPRTPPIPGRVSAPMILFWSDTRACLATLRSDRGLDELTEEDLRRHLRACLSG